MAKIERTKKSVETKEVEQTETITRYKCDVCGHEYPNSGELNSFSINPRVDDDVVGIEGLENVIEVDVPGDGHINLRSALMMELVPARNVYDVHTRPSSITAVEQRENFEYSLTVEGESDDHKDVCDDCYDVLF